MKRVNTYRRWKAVACWYGILPPLHVVSVKAAYAQSWRSYHVGGRGQRTCSAPGSSSTSLEHHVSCWKGESRATIGFSVTAREVIEHVLLHGCINTGRHVSFERAMNTTRASSVTIIATITFSTKTSAEASSEVLEVIQRLQLILKIILSDVNIQCLYEILQRMVKSTICQFL